MKYAGKEISGPSTEVVVIPRSDGDLVFRAKAVLDYGDFEKLCPTPEAPPVIHKGGAKGFDTEDKVYLEAMDVWSSAKTNWMILKSLQATDELEWETVDMSDPATWGNYETELASSGFSPAEVFRIVGIVITACGLNQQKIDEATERFLAGVAAAPSSVSSPSSEQPTIQSGEDASASE